MCPLIFLIFQDQWKIKTLLHTYILILLCFHTRCSLLLHFSDIQGTTRRRREQAQRSHELCFPWGRQSTLYFIFCDWLAVKTKSSMVSDASPRKPHFTQYGYYPCKKIHTAWSFITVLKAGAPFGNWDLRLSSDLNFEKPWAWWRTIYCT